MLPGIVFVPLPGWISCVELSNGVGERHGGPGSLIVGSDVTPDETSDCPTMGIRALTETENPFMIIIGDRTKTTTKKARPTWRRSGK